MSTVPPDGLNAGPEEVCAELDAMQAVGLALLRLQDPRALARVLRWAAERFEVPFETSWGNSGGPTAPVATCPIDQSVTMDGVLELFDAPSRSPRSETVELESIEPPPVHREAVEHQTIRLDAAEPEPLDSLMRGFAIDLQRVAVEWQGA